MDRHNEADYQAIPRVEEPRRRRSSRTSVAFSQLFAIFHIVVGAVLPLARAFEQIHQTQQGHERDLQWWHLDAYFLYLSIGSITLLIVMRVFGMLATHEGEQSHQAASKFIKGGAALFGACGMLAESYKLGCIIDGSCSQEYGHKKAIDGIEAFLSVFFILFLWLFVCVYSNKCITKWKRLARIAIMLMWATCLSYWCRRFVFEASDDVLEGNFNYSICLNKTSKNNKSNLTDNKMDYRFLTHHDNDNVNDDKKLKDSWDSASHFLTPGAMEFYLIMSGFMYVMYGNIGKHANNPPNRPSAHYYSLKNSLVGLGCGFLVLIVSIIIITLLSNSETSDKVWSQGRPSDVYFGFMVCLYPLCILGNILSHVKMRRSKTWLIDNTKEDELRLTMTLMYISASGLFIGSIFTMIAAAQSPHSTHAPHILLYHECLKIIDVFTSVIFLYDALHRRPPPEFNPNYTRQIIVFLIISNFVFWYTNIVELKDLGPNTLQTCFYGFEVWTIIRHLLSPLGIYFRFHSMVLYFEVWLSG